MAFDLILFKRYCFLKGLSERYIKELMYYALRLNLYGKFNQEVINNFLIEKSNQNNVARAFIKIFQKFLIHFKEELISKGELSQEDLTRALEVQVPQITGRKKVRLKNPLTDSEMKLLEETLDTEELKLMFLICYNGGVRLQELMKIRLNSFNWNKMLENKEGMGELRILGKNNKEGVAILPNWLMRKIKDYIQNNKIPFGGRDSYLFKKSGHMSERTFEIKLRQAGMRAGITKKGENGEWIQSTIVHPHKLRNQLGHDLVKENKNLRVIQEALRHANISSTQIYTQISKEELKEALDSRNKPREEAMPKEQLQKDLIRNLGYGLLEAES